MAVLRVELVTEDRVLVGGELGHQAHAQAVLRHVAEAVGAGMGDRR